MKSMTGYGRGECSSKGFKVSVEITSVNRKQAEVVFNLPPELEPLETRLRDEVHRRLGRGRLTVKVGLHLSQEQWNKRAHLNLPMAKAYAHQLARLGKELNLSSLLTCDALLRLPGVVQAENGAEEAEAFWTPLMAAIETALRGLTATRQREGAHLARELKARVAAMRRRTADVARLTPKVARRYLQQLRNRLRQAGIDGLDLNDERIVKEVVLFADRSDITEELTRLESHFQQFDDSLKAAEPVGRMLDFLAQEMNREINTIGSKANDAAIARAVIALKTDLEKFREQVQNVE